MAILPYSSGRPIPLPISQGGTGSKTQNFVDLTTNQTVGGAKTFNAGTFLDKGSQVFNVKAYGATGNGTTDDTTSIQNAINAANTAGGGIIFFPVGTYLISTALSAYSNLTFRGVSSNSSIIHQSSTTAHGLLFNNTSASAGITNVMIENLAFNGPTSGTGHGIYLENTGASSTYPPFSYFTLLNVQIDNFGGYGFNAESLIVSSLQNVAVHICGNGFYLNGAAHGTYSTISTSVSFINTYAHACTGIGYNITYSTYISFLGTAADANDTSYTINSCNSVSFTSAGAEYTATGTHISWNITASMQVGLYNCYSYRNPYKAIVVTASSQATIIGFQENTPNAATYSLEVDAGSYVSELDNSYTTAVSNAGTRVVLNNGIGTTVLQTLYLPYTGILKTDVNCLINAVTAPAGTIVGTTDTQTLTNKRITPRVNTTASSATPSINTDTTDVFTITALAVAITSMTTNLTGTPTIGQKLLIRIKDNGTARAITWGVSFASSGMATLLSTTVASKTHMIAFIWDEVVSKWICMAVDATGY